MPFGTMTWNSALPYRNPATVARLVGSQSRPRRPAARYRPGEAGGLPVIQGKKRLWLPRQAHRPLRPRGAVLGLLPGSVAGRLSAAAPGNHFHHSENDADGAANEEEQTTHQD